MNQNPDKVLSASRRTDIPAFYTDWFMDQIKLGFFDVKNPYNRTVKRVEVSKDLIHSIVFWSKNFDPFLTAKAGEKLQKLGYDVYFNFTINSESNLFEPNLPPLKKRLEQLKRIALIFGSQSISWRFDPIYYYRTHELGPVKNNLADFTIIAKHASKLGIKKCVTSFFDDYAKIRKRLNFLNSQNHKAVSFIDPGTDKKIQVIHRMEKHLGISGIKLYLCCEKELLSNFETKTNIQANACIDANLLQTLYGGNPESKRDLGQRSKNGCKCTKSIDIGSYEDHPCFHDCLFCYANPQIDNLIKEKNK